MNPRVRQDDHLVAKFGNQRLEGVIRDVRSGVISRHNQAVLIDEIGQFGSNDPAMVRQTLATDLAVGAAFAPGMAQFDAVAVEAKQACAFGQVGKLRAIVVVQSAIKRVWADALEGEEQRQGHDLTRIQVRIGAFGDINHDGINAQEQGHDKIIGRHANPHVHLRAGTRPGRPPSFAEFLNQSSTCSSCPSVVRGP
jgi:hypothetical protein